MPPSPPTSPPARPVLAEKTAYVPKSGEEAFIVPLLRAAVEAALATHGRRGGRAIDVGCGGQPFRAAVEAPGMVYHSMDAMPQPGITTDFLCPIDGPLPEALVALPPFDLILCTEVLEHVADWNAAWTNLASLLAPGGTLIVTCPFFYPLHEEPYDFFRPTLHAIRHWSVRHGLAPVELRKLGTVLDVIGTAVAASGIGPVRRTPVSWLIGTIARKKRKLAGWALRRRLFQQHLTHRDTLYLSNFAVITKPL